MRKELEVFANEMESVLVSKDELHPKGWSEDSASDLMSKLDDKVAHMIYGFDSEAIDDKKIHELAIDIANFAMMIADKTRGINNE